MAESEKRLLLESEAFEAGKPIPSRYTADGPDRSPALSWRGVPAQARSLALVCEDPDAPRGNWVHWVLYGIPPSTTSLPEAVPPSASLPGGGTHGKNDFGRLGYGGPAPPSGTHRYFFRLYAIDVPLALPAGATRAELTRAIEGHVLARGELMGTYSRR
ncbi:MAG TPA: YbhB/YbcL family Raf kinase inhibitor-like protein [Thermoanaerobaculia bacterium]|nr:YbhB/YbcL family Raf kinase inhibitor-like protein [Thermoanaerobaculia bacterium]